jgi:23S rRNA pseudouridine1911/1915/1917 synthase
MLRLQLEVLYEDNHLIAVYKPAGLRTQPDDSHEPSMLELVREHLRGRDEKPGRVFLGLLHRLDRPVAGVLLLAKTSKGASRVSAQIRSRSMVKTYAALTEGVPRAGGSGNLRHFLGPEPGRSKRVSPTSQPETKEAELTYRVLRRFGGLALVEVDLKTGRKHQIRAQLAHEGSPILGDFRYGATQPFRSGGVALVGRRIRILQPVTGEPIEIALPDRLCPISAWLRSRGYSK